MSAIRDEQLRYHLGADALADIWRPDDPALIALTLVHFAKLSRAGLIDLAPFVDAVRERGWLPVDG